MGFWSGRNMESQRNSMVGHTTDIPGIIAEVKVVCERSPSLSVMLATSEAYKNLEDQKR